MYMSLIFMSSPSDEFTLLWESSKTDVFAVSGRIFVPLKGTPTWRFINLGKTFFQRFAYEILYHTDLILGEAFCIFIFFYFPDSALSVLNGLQHWPILANPFLSKKGMGRRQSLVRPPLFSCQAICCELWQAWFKIQNFLSGLTALGLKHFFQNLESRGSD